MNQNSQDLKHIRSMMERSSKVLSLSGISGVLAGSFALLGAYLAHLVLQGKFKITSEIGIDLFLIAGFVLVGAATSGIFFSIRKAKKMKTRFFTKPTIGIMIDAGVPLAVGGVFCLFLIYYHVTFLIPSVMLLFCGLGLISAGSRTYRDVKLLGASLIIIGILAGIFTRYNLLLWAVGFGFMFIIYGVVMYYKYDMKSDKND